MDAISFQLLKVKTPFKTPFKRTAWVCTRLWRFRLIPILNFLPSEVQWSVSKAGHQKREIHPRSIYKQQGLYINVQKPTFTKWRGLRTTSNLLGWGRVLLCETGIQQINKSLNLEATPSNKTILNFEGRLGSFLQDGFLQNAPWAFEIHRGFLALTSLLSEKLHWQISIFMPSFSTSNF